MPRSPTHAEVLQSGLGVALPMAPGWAGRNSRSSARVASKATQGLAALSRDSLGLQIRTKPETQVAAAKSPKSAWPCG